MSNNTIIPSFYFANKFLYYKDILHNYNIKRATYSKGDILTVPGEINNTAYYINSGIIIVSLGHENGGEKSIAMFGPGSIFPIGLTDHKYKMDFEIILKAFTDLDVYKFSYLTLREMALDNHDLTIGLLEEDCDFISYLFHDSISQAFESSITRLCDVLYLYYINSPLCQNVISLPQSSLASFTGSSIAQVERVLKKLREEKIIETSRNKILILNLEQLLSYCSDNVRNS